MEWIFASSCWNAAGRRAVANAVKLLGGLKWGIAGRNDERLMEVLKEVGQQLDKNLLDIPIAVADVNDENSLLKMAECAKVNSYFEYDKRSTYTFYFSNIYKDLSDK